MNILTFDIEEWYTEMVFRGARDFKFQQYDDMFGKLLDDLNSLRIKATFFCVGRLAVEFPKVVKMIAERGHDVGCHSNEHTWLNKMDEKSLKKDTIDAIKALEDVSGQKVNSYRAPAFSITQQNKWAFNVLAECGIENDASIFPTNRDFGGYKGFPSDNPCVIVHDGASLKEFPICISSLFGKDLAYSGGGYFRMLPYRFISNTMKKRNYNICYFHLNDLIQEKKHLMTKNEYEEYFKEPGSLKNRLIRYVKGNIGTGDAYGKMSKLLSNNKFVNISEANKLINWNKVSVINL